MTELVQSAGRWVTVHALRAMLDRDISPRDLVTVLDAPDGRYLGYPGADGQDRIVHQWRDIAAVTSRDEQGRPLVVTVLYRIDQRTGQRWQSSDGRPSGRRISRQTRRRLAAMIRNARAAAETVIELPGGVA